MSDFEGRHGLHHNEKEEDVNENELVSISKAKERACIAYMESTVVDISIKPSSFKLVPLSLPRSPLSKTPKQVFF